jgi:hypothetical protein
MQLCVRRSPGSAQWIAAILFAGLACGVAANASENSQPPASQSAQAAVRQVGTIKAISGKTITLTPDAGGEVTVQVQDDAKLLRIAPGETNLKNAAPLQLQDLQIGDRILVRGANGGPDGKTLLASSVIAMKQADIASKQAHDREEWQRNGVGGLVTKIDAASGTIVIATNSIGATKDVTVHVSKQTGLIRYAPNSVKFSDAVAAAIDQIKVGDQVRARGTRSADGAELTADEVVSGTFRNVAGTINSIDSAAGTITLTDLVAKKPVTVKVTNDTQLRKLPPQMAQMIAMRLKGGGPDAVGANGSAGGAARPTAGGQSSGPGGGQGSPSGAGRPGTGPGGAGGAGRGGDMQQMLSRLPALTLANLQKGDAVMIVTTEGTQEQGATAITLLAGVEPILEASPKDGASSILTPWTMSGAPGDAAP